MPLEQPLSSLKQEARGRNNHNGNHKHRGNLRLDTPSNTFLWGELVWGELGAGSWEGAFCIGITVTGETMLRILWGPGLCLLMKNSSPMRREWRTWKQQFRRPQPGPSLPVGWPTYLALRGPAPGSLHYYEKRNCDIAMHYNLWRTSTQFSRPPLEVSVSLISGERNFKSYSLTSCPNFDPL